MSSFALLPPPPIWLGESSLCLLSALLTPLPMWSAGLRRLYNQTIHVVMLATWYESALSFSLHSFVSTPLSMPSPLLHYVQFFSGGLSQPTHCTSVVSFIISIDKKG
ncbi:hypothetical protein BC941DRAFT_9177 [Chlamydoabsidia padenii]|nr:hypothetical protein BC941DRAFT_9177 [Chlamydoabsidia padenii]